MPQTDLPSVRYMASFPVGVPVESMGMPRELNTMQAVFAIVLPELSRHAGASPIVVCVFDGGVLTLPNPKLSPVDRGSALGPPSFCAVPAAGHVQAPVVPTAFVQVWISKVFEVSLK